jgi:hypothetical protein
MITSKGVRNVSVTRKLRRERQSGKRRRKQRRRGRRSVLRGMRLNEKAKRGALRRLPVWTHSRRNSHKHEKEQNKQQQRGGE